SGRAGPPDSESVSAGIPTDFCLDPKATWPLLPVTCAPRRAPRSMVAKDFDPPRTRILEAAVQLFARYGLERTTLADIAQCAHLSKATLYHHFPEGKASIFHAAVEGIIER